MGVTATDKIAILQRFVNRYPEDLIAARGVLADPATTPAAQRFIIGALNYALDVLDIFPDHHKGLGIADDAIVLRLAAKLAVDAGATHATLVALAGEATEVATVFEDLAGPLATLVAKYPEREVRGRTSDKILAHKDTRIMFEADVGREAKRHQPEPIDTTQGADRALVELRKMIVHSLKQAGITVA